MSAVELAVITAAIPLTILVIAASAIAWRSLTLPPDGQDHVRQLIKLLSRIIRDLRTRGDQRADP